MSEITPHVDDLVDDIVRGFVASCGPGEGINPHLTRAHVTKAITALRSLPVEQRMEAMGMRRAGPFGADGHGIGCAYRRGHECDCTARTAVYWTEAR